MSNISLRNSQLKKILFVVKVQFRHELLPQLPKNTKFFHPLPRDSTGPTIPFETNQIWFPELLIFVQVILKWSKSKKIVSKFYVV
jgi:hypothetical protein